MSHFGNIEHHLIVAIIDHIPSGWVMFNGDMTNDPCPAFLTEAVLFTAGLLTRRAREASRGFSCTGMFLTSKTVAPRLPGLKHKQCPVERGAMWSPVDA